jgi:hypothetical protein
MHPGQHPGKGDRKDTGTADGRNDAVSTGGPRGASGYAAMPQRDRDAILQAQKAKYPPEYGPLIEQYTRGIADKEGK